MAEKEASPFPSAANTSPALTTLFLPKPFLGKVAKAQRLKATSNNAAGYLSLHRTQDKLDLKTTFTALPCPAHNGVLHQSAASCLGSKSHAGKGGL